MNAGKFTFEGIEALYQPLGHFAFGGREDLKILGILGYPELEGFELMLNYPKSTIGFLVLDEKGGRVSKTALPDPVQTMAFTYSGHLPVLNCEAGGEKLRMGLDTGAETILLASKFRKKLEASLQQKHTAENVGPDNKPVEALVGLLPEMTVEGRKHADMLTMFTEIPNISGEGGMSLDGMLGFPFLSNHRLVSINFRKKEVTLW
jgi:hypothetical protein